MSTAAISVVIPTIGRSGLLDGCLASIRAGRDAPAEVLVVDQSGSDLVKQTADAYEARVVPCGGTGIPLAVNAGIRAAGEQLVAVTHDDCVVDRNWVRAAAELAASHPAAIITGRVLPGGDPRFVPACRDRPDPWVFREGASFGAILPNNLAMQRDGFLAVGGFDERFDVVGEDLDMAYRWARGNRTVRYEPSMVVEHRSWRTPLELRRTYQEYARGAGVFYAKHLRAGDLSMMRLLAADGMKWLKAIARAVRTGRWDATEPSLGFVPGTVKGLWQGMRRFS